jgi:TolB-like protein
MGYRSSSGDHRRGSNPRVVEDSLAVVSFGFFLASSVPARAPATEELITTLAHIKSLRVISRTSITEYKNTRKSVPEIAKELNVDAVVEGSVLLAGDRVRITAQLIEAATDKHLWAESYERDLGDVLALQSAIARSITEQIQATLVPAEEARLAAAPRVRPDAYRSYLLGLNARERLEGLR